MNLYCSTGVLFNIELGFDFFAFAQQCLTKKLEEKTIDYYSPHVRLFGFYTQQNGNSAANFVFTRSSGDTVGLICSRNIRLSTLGV